ncbi:HIT domain-containing protein [Candidatus Peregrinibacteria bacterium]|nr:HIT domain-containing protein [Candidatus Peregrinibacteria bacterium]
MEDCIFCKISQGVVKTDFLYEDEDCVVFKDIHPKAKTHLLIVSKKHIDSVMEANEQDEELLGKLVFCSKKIAKKLNISAFNLQINVGKEAGQEIPHIHIHLMSNFAQ